MGTVPIPLRQTLLGFLTETVRSALVHTPPDPSTPSEEDLERVHAALAAGDGEGEVWREPVMEALMRQTLVDLRATAPVLYEAIRPFLTCADAQTRIRAVEAAAAIARLGDLDLDLSGAADMAESRDEGAVIVLALGECGRDTSEFLSHADPAIRACAALAPSQSGNPAATEELLAALAEPAEADSWFTTRPAFFTGPVRVALVRALTERSNAEDARRLLPVLRALAPLASPFVADQDSGPLLALAFPTHNAARGPRAPALTSRDLTDLQRDYLRVLANSDGYWHDTIANFRLCLARLGLPREREGIRALLDV